MFNYKQKRFRIAQLQVDDITKKPLQHFMNGTKSLTLGLFGCDYRCSWCINWELSQPSKENDFQRSIGEDDFRSAEEICDLAQTYDCKSITFSFSEPTLWHEYAFYIAEEAHKRGLKTVWKSNGNQTAKLIPQMKTLIDAANIDLKYASDEDYAKYCGDGKFNMKLQPVLDTIKGLHEAGVHVEVSTVMMPTMNSEELKKIASMICQISPEIVWHINRFHNMYISKERWGWSDRPQLSSDEVIEIGHQAGLKHVYSFEKRPWARGQN